MGKIESKHIPQSGKVKQMLEDLGKCDSVIFVSSPDLKAKILSIYPHLNIKVCEKPRG